MSDNKLITLIIIAFMLFLAGGVGAIIRDSDKKADHKQEIILKCIAAHGQMVQDTCVFPQIISAEAK